MHAIANPKNWESALFPCTIEPGFEFGAFGKRNLCSFFCPFTVPAWIEVVTALNQVGRLLPRTDFPEVLRVRAALSSDDEEAEGDNGFDYRRMYLTADYTLSEEFSGRARLEAASQPVDSAPFVKDLYLKWKGAIADGHDLIFGVQSPPSYTLSEKIWGYRSLEKTIMDRNKIVSSRDMGVQAAGKLTQAGNLKYAVMVGNNNSVRGEDDKYKRVYGQVTWQSDKVAASVGGDFASGDDRMRPTRSTSALPCDPALFAVFLRRRLD